MIPYWPKQDGAVCIDVSGVVPCAALTVIRNGQKGKIVLSTDHVRETTYEYLLYFSIFRIIWVFSSRLVRQ